jgi:hypothetical protein
VYRLLFLVRVALAFTQSSYIITLEHWTYPLLRSVIARVTQVFREQAVTERLNKARGVGEMALVDNTALVDMAGGQHCIFHLARGVKRTPSAVVIMGMF